MASMSTATGAGSSGSAPPGGFSDTLAAILATFFGSGLSPVWPGTAGSFATLPLAWGLMAYGWPALLSAAAVIFVIGTWAAGRYCRRAGKHDDGRIVIDEVVGMLITLLPAPRSLVALLLGFGLFRLFDIWKPGPIRLVDRRVHGGVGVMLDDVVAAIFAAASLFLILYALNHHYPGGYRGFERHLLQLLHLGDWRPGP